MNATRPGVAPPPEPTVSEPPPPDPIKAMYDALAVQRPSRAVMAAQQQAAHDVIDMAERSARTTRRASGSMPAVRPGRPASGDTGRYAAIRETMPVDDGGLKV